MINFIGDVSQEDAQVLKWYAECSENILEFGSGGSTQILASYAKGDVTSVESDIGWITKTRKNIDLLGIDKQVNFVLYDEFKFEGEYDFIFNDGVDGYRREFGINAFKHLKTGGYLIYHDCKRTGDVLNVAALIGEYSAYIESVTFHPLHSNMAVIKKKIPEFYINWNETENKPAWKQGWGDVPPEEIENLRK